MPASVFMEGSLGADSNIVRGLVPTPLDFVSGETYLERPTGVYPAGAAHGALCLAMLPTQGLQVVRYKIMQQQKQQW